MNQKTKSGLKIISNNRKLITFIQNNPFVVTQLMRMIGEDINEDWFKKGSKKDRALKLKISKLYSKAFKQMSGSPNQEKIKNDSTNWSGM